MVAANWSGAYKYAKGIAEQVDDEVKDDWVELPMPVPSTWPFRLEQQNGTSQGLKDDSTPKVRRAADKGHGSDSVNQCIELVSKLKFCTNLQIGKGAATSRSLYSVTDHNSVTRVKSGRTRRRRPPVPPALSPGLARALQEDRLAMCDSLCRLFGRQVAP